MRILFFSPFANVWDHSLVEHGVASSLTEVGHEVYLIGCKGAFLPQCTSTMERKLIFSEDLNQESKKICDSCQKRSVLLENNFVGVNKQPLEDYIHSEDAEVINSFLTKVSPKNFIDKKYGELPVGRLAMYEFSLKHKLRDISFGLELWPEYLHQLNNVLVSTIVTQRIIERIKPDRLIVHNSLYSTNRAACLVAEELGIPTYSIGAGQNFDQRQRSFSLFRSAEDWIGLSRSTSWFEYSGNVNQPVDIEASEAHFLKIMSGSDAFTYSVEAKQETGNDTRAFFGINDGQKICVATLSSEDENFAAELLGVVPDFTGGTSFFHSQLDWISNLINFFSQNPKLALIIRVHPREFPNKREPVMAESAIRLGELFKKLPENVKINWPDDEISVYEIAEISDLLLNWRSTVGVEFLALGIPVLVPSCSNLLSYPIEFNHVANSETEYQELIHRLVDDSWSMSNVINAYRWLTYLTNFAAFEINTTERAPKSLTALRPKTPGLMLQIWERSINTFLNHVPLFLESSSAGKWTISPDAISIINDTLEWQYSSLADAKLNNSGNLKPLSETYWNELNSQLSNSLIKRISVVYEDTKKSNIFNKLLSYNINQK